MFSMVTVASSTRMPTASASPPSVMMLSVSPSAEQMIAPRIESGIDTAMMTVERQLPRNSRIITLVSAAAMMPRPRRPRWRRDEHRLVADEHDLQLEPERRS